MNAGRPIELSKFIGTTANTIVHPMNCFTPTSCNERI